MIGLDVLRGLLGTTRAPKTMGEGFVHLDPAAADAMTIVQRIAIETIAAIGDHAVSTAAREAIARRHDVLWIGIAPKDVRLTPDGFVVVAKIRFEGSETQHAVLIRSCPDHRVLSIASCEAVPARS